MDFVTTPVVLFFFEVPRFDHHLRVCDHRHPGVERDQVEGVRHRRGSPAQERQVQALGRPQPPGPGVQTPPLRHPSPEQHQRALLPAQLSGAPAVLFTDRVHEGVW